MLKKTFIIMVMSLILIVNMLTMSVMAAPQVVELIKPISDIKTINKNIIISGWAKMDTQIRIKVFVREINKVDGSDEYRWEEYRPEGTNNSIVVGPTGFFAKEIELKSGLNRVTIKAVDPSGEEQVIEGEVTLSSKEEIRETVKNLLNFNFLDIIKKIIK